MNDPIVEEIRRVRDEHARRFDYDLAAICNDIRKQQSRYGDRVIRLRRDRRGIQPVADIVEDFATPLDTVSRPLRGPIR
uniref:Uncharacterized protein n=1 Tax=Candidatus Kentrum sp. FM TaxID=2126340 RepID=A0A450VTW4_9GAMM|nr:MAG: hypothetical protein BECKFM1743C_GA0114222_100416 [Candidatus Kentron sp. FM]VFJ48927.1 MAG: hypothetical protein BECKFM1743A_GA0114220_1006412 [Candidatus Kentron sp. FM]VFK08233.1 MAG: hypothetical protein BECKFM1743B_GA0114221_1006311 [Candidatus Kentron sp. FM]